MLCVLFFSRMTNFVKFGDFMVKIQEFELIILHKTKQLHQDKVHWQIVESV